MHIEPTARQLAEIIALKRAPSFASLAEQIPGVERVEEGRISALESGRLPEEVGPRPELELRAIWLKSVVVVGGLDHDLNAENPLNDDGMGKIYRCSRWNSENSEAYEALGLDSEGRPNLDLPAVYPIVVERVMKHIQGDRNLKARLERSMRRWGHKDPSELQVAIEVVCEGSAYPDDLSTELTGEYCYRLKEGREADRRFAEDCEALSDLISRSWEPAWEEARDRGEVGNPLAVILDVFEHGGIMFSVSGYGPQCQWDTTIGGAIWVPDDVAHDCIMTSEDPRPKHELAREYAEQACKAYTAWCNGQTYVVSAFAVDRQTGAIVDGHEESFGDVVGYSEAEDEMEQQLLAMAKSLAK